MLNFSSYHNLKYYMEEISKYLNTEDVVNMRLINKYFYHFYSNHVFFKINTNFENDKNKEEICKIKDKSNDCNTNHKEFDLYSNENYNNDFNNYSMFSFCNNENSKIYDKIKLRRNLKIMEKDIAMFTKSDSNILNIFIKKANNFDTLKLIETINNYNKNHNIPNNSLLKSKL